MPAPVRLKPQRLQAGDTVGIVSPSWGGAGAFPFRVESGIAQLALFGLKAKIATHALNARGFVSDTPENRVSDLHEMFRDPEVRLVLAAIGGDHACHLLPQIDFDLIRQHPKLFMGYSDITVLNIAIWQATGLVTFNGPALLTDFAEHPEMQPYTAQWFRKATFDAEPIGAITPARGWTEERQAWTAEPAQRCPRSLIDSEGWTWLKAGVADGVLIGGCIESLQHLGGTRFWPDWTDAILFFETSEEKPMPEAVDAVLMDYENMGVLQKLRGLLVGRPNLYTAEEKAELRAVILDRTSRYDFPIITDMDFGHTSPQLTLPIGCRGKIDSPSKRFEIVESAVTM
jgi:muramoyltetrapeptide carboxypeptidase LdcA involved in peptidoglycan recycling